MQSLIYGAIFPILYTPLYYAQHNQVGALMKLKWPIYLRKMSS